MQIALGITWNGAFKVERIFTARPFKTRNADEYDINTLLNLFVNPLIGLSTPFDYENSIIKGRMGSGKTMYLRANQAFYLSALLPALMEGNDEIILPIMIKLNDFQHISDPDEIYKQIVVKIVEELVSIHHHLEGTKNLVSIHGNLKMIPRSLIARHKNSEMMLKISELSSDEYLNKVSLDKQNKASMKFNFIEASTDWKTNHYQEFKKKPSPGIKDIEECYKYLLNDAEGKILLLLDEAGALDKGFFKGGEGRGGLFEVLMNQFRTASFIRTKVAVYPNSYSDMLTETRYGDVVMLENSVMDEAGYKRLRAKAIDIINNYINPKSDESMPFRAEDVFEINDKSIYGDALEMILYASHGNMRRLIHIFDMSMDAAYSEGSYAKRVEKNNVIEALRRHAVNNEGTLSNQEKEFLESLVKVCRSRSAYKFSFPNVPLYKYTSRSREYNIINVDEPGSGRKATVYSFDFSFCVLKDIPTHRMNDDERVYKERSGDLGRWSSRKAIISNNMIEQASFPGKIEGKITWYDNEKKHGFITVDGSPDKKINEYYFQCKQIIEEDKGKTIHVGKRLRFYPSETDGGELVAYVIEVL
ncbi:cold-shock protein [Enterobacter kobei]|uniref:cold-shock protein n=1 Tax=Enterobacter kobei TaxID=208224 RepID=UPI0018C23979|nr:hypothetical protein [Enterobacter kobei]MBG0581320.1 hypothetical protein [Enterobacter kobei]